MSPRPLAKAITSRIQSALINYISSYTHNTSSLLYRLDFNTPDNTKRTGMALGYVCKGNWAAPVKGNQWCWFTSFIPTIYFNKHIIRLGGR